MPLPGIPVFPGLESIGDLQNLGEAGPSMSGDITGDQRGPSLKGPVINVATGGGSTGGSSDIALALSALAGIATVFYLLKNKK